MTDLERQAREAIEVEAIVNGEIDGLHDGWPADLGGTMNTEQIEREMQRIEAEGDRAQTERDERAKMEARMRMEQPQPPTKEQKARQLINRVSSGGVMVNPAGDIRVYRNDDGGFHWQAGKVTSTVDYEQAVKRLTGYKAERVNEMVILSTLVEHQDHEQNQEKKEEKIRERVGLGAVRRAVANPDKKNQPKSKKVTKPKAKPELPEGFEPIKGGEIQKGDVIIAKNGQEPELVVSVKCFEEDCSVKHHHKLMLVPADPDTQDGTENAPRKKWASVHKAFPVKRA